MTSKERCEALMEYIVEENQGYFDKERIGNDLTAILEDLEELEYQKRKNADLLETINCIRSHAVIKKAKGLGAEVIVSFHSSDDDFEKVGWVFDIVK